MSENVQKTTSVKEAARRLRVLELRGQGLTLEKIAESVGVNEKTVRRDLESIDSQAYLDELTRRQLADIETAELETRLNFRDRLIDKLRPKGPAPIQIQQKVEVETHGPSYAELFAEYGDVLNAEIARREASSRRPDGSDIPQPVGPESTAPQDGEKRPEP